MAIYARRITTLLGEMVALVDEAGALTALGFCRGQSAEALAREWAAPGEAVVMDDERGGDVVAQLEEYFRGERRDFELRLAPRGSAFQQRVWAELRRVPYGTTVSYGQLAERVGMRSATASRAIGRANATNPIAIVVPCHRVIGADGALTGYAAGLDLKAKLLVLEGARLEGPGHAPVLAGVHRPARRSGNAPSDAGAQADLFAASAGEAR